MPNIKEDLRFYKAEIAKIEPKVLALQETVRGLEKLLALEIGNTNVSKVTETLNIVFPKGTFNGLTTRQAALKCSQLAGRSLTTRQMVELIEGAGFKHNAKKFWNSLNTTLDRMYKKEQTMNKDPKGWRINDKGRAEVVQKREIFKLSPTNEPLPPSQQSLSGVQA